MNEETQKVLSALKEQAETLKATADSNSLKRMDSDFKVSLPFDEFAQVRKGGFKAGVIIKAIDTEINYSKNAGVILTICNGFVIKAVQKGYNKVDLKAVKNEMNTTIWDRKSFNLLIQTELKNNPVLVIDSLKALK